MPNTFIPPLKVNKPPGKGADHLHWFVQVSDLHFSVFNAPTRYQDFQDFCLSHLNVIKPEVVLITGDLTDAKNENKRGSQQYKWEWQRYQESLQTCLKQDGIVWLDIRGNHDAFDTPTLDSPNNYFRKYSIQGQNHSASYKYVHTSGEDKYTFVAVDSTPKPGLKRPFNFFGILLQDAVLQLDNLTANLNGNDGVVMFGHYPSSLIASHGNTHRRYLSKGIAYLSGHLHTFGGIAERMYSRQKEGFLELELGDWMSSRIYRIFAFDHGLFSFADFNYGYWPAVVITNPLHAQFMEPHKEPIDNVRMSSHIRLLVFSQWDIASVVASIDGIQLGLAEKQHGPLYTIPWNTTHYGDGLHTLQVTAMDAHKNKRTVIQPFSLDDTEVTSHWLRRAILMINHVRTVVIITLGVVLALFLPLVMATFLRRKTLHVINCLASSRLTKPFAWALECLCALTAAKHIFYPMLAYDIYVCLGPWFIGEISGDEIGVMFSYGIYICGTMLPATLTLAYAAVHIIFLCWPLTLYLGHCLLYRSVTENGSLWIRIKHVGLPAIYFSVYLFFACREIYSAYGLMACLLGPVRTWTVVFVLVMVWMAKQSETDATKDPSANTTG